MNSSNGMSGTPFDLTGRIAVITGGGGLLGAAHARAVASAGGTPVLLDVNAERAVAVLRALPEPQSTRGLALGVNVTLEEQIVSARDEILRRFGRVDILINNAANNPRVEAGGVLESSRLENLSLEQWTADFAVGVTGAFLCSRVFGSTMARAKKGVILNIASDLAVIAPDQRLYRKPGLADHEQPVKPVTYSVVKSALIGLTRYLATYWAESGVRCNALSPGGVRAGQPDEFVSRLASLIPMGRMAAVDEYEGAVIFLVSDASSYMTGQNLVVDGGRTCW